MTTKATLLGIGLAFLALLCTIGCNEPAVDLTDTFTLSGTVIDDDTGEALSGAQISLNPTLGSAVSDSTGAFRFEALTTAVESYTLNIELDGYRRFVRAISTETISGDVSVVANLEQVSLSTNEPTRPSDPSPALGATAVARSLFLSWDATAPNTDELRFDVFFGAQGNVSRIARAIEDTVYRVEDLSFGESYTWQVAAYTSDSDTLYSQVWFFTTEVTPDYPLAFTLNEDGTSVIYAGDEGVNRDDYFRITPEGVGAFRPKYSPDGENIAFLQLDGTDIYLTVANADGTNRRRVYGRPLLNIFPELYDFDWTSDGTRIVFGYLSDVVSVEVLTLRAVFVTRLPAGTQVMDVDIHPNSEEYLLGTFRDNGLVSDVMRYNSTTRLLDTLVADTVGLISGPEYSPSGNQFLVSIDLSGQENISRRQLDATLFEYDLVNGRRNSLSDNKPAGANDLSATYSPDGGFVYFTRGSNASNANRGIWRVNRDNNGVNSAVEVVAQATGPTLR